MEVARQPHAVDRYRRLDGHQVDARRLEHRPYPDPQLHCKLQAPLLDQEGDFPGRDGRHPGPVRVPRLLDGRARGLTEPSIISAPISVRVCHRHESLRPPVVHRPLEPHRSQVLLERVIARGVGRAATPKFVTRGIRGSRATPVSGFGSLPRSCWRAISRTPVLASCAGMALEATRRARSEPPSGARRKLPSPRLEESFDRVLDEDYSGVRCTPSTPSAEVRIFSHWEAMSCASANVKSSAR